MSDAEPVFAERLMLCIGAVSLQGSKPKGMEWLLDPAHSNNLRVFLPRDAIKTARPGTMYWVPIAGEGNATLYQTSKARFARTWNDADDVLKWSIAHDARLAMEREAAMAKKGQTKAVAQALEALEPLRVLHRGTDKWGRSVIEALVLQYLKG